MRATARQLLKPIAPRPERRRIPGILSELRAPRTARPVSVRAVRVLTTFLQLSGKARHVFRDLHSEALRVAEGEFRTVRTLRSPLPHHAR